MSDTRDKTTSLDFSAVHALETRYASSFWDGVEVEVEALDVSDFQEFLESDALPIEPHEGFRKQLSGYLKGLVRARFSH
ncbi:MAG: hypothetical protein GY725_15740 [bacterium]|nr:hypothetical protein [bacterium]